MRPSQRDSAAHTDSGAQPSALRHFAFKAAALFCVSALAVMAFKGRGISPRADSPQGWLLVAEAILYAGVLYHARPMRAHLWTASSVGLVCLRVAWTASLGLTIWFVNPGLDLAGTVRQTLLGYPPAAYVPMLLICAVLVFQKQERKPAPVQQEELPRWATQAIERQAGRTAETAPTAEEPQILISWAALLRQFPDPAVKVFEKQIERAPWEDVRLPLSAVLPQLEQGRVILSLRELLGRLPGRIARSLARQLSASMAEGVVELPLEEIVAQISPTFFQGVTPAAAPQWWTEEAKEALERMRFSLRTGDMEAAESTGGKAS